VGNKEEAKRRLIDAAGELLRTRSPSAVSGRELARQAGVNYGLVHRYFGSKDQVFRAAIAELAADFARDVAPLSEDRWVTISAMAEHESLWRAMANYALDDDFRASTDLPYPILRGRTESSAASARDRARFRATVELVLALGWVLFQPLVRDAFDLGDNEMDAMGAKLDEFMSGLWGSDEELAGGEPRGHE
jgi:AcrR family transcriptional regulator